jgi:protein-disulfide isomerase
MRGDKYTINIILVMALALLLAGCATNTQSVTESIQDAPAQDEQYFYDVSAENEPFIGDEDAPITVIAFEDYQCPHCKSFSQNTLKEIQKKYIDTGKVRFVFRDFPAVHKHPDALMAAIAANCAQDQGRYWDYHDILFENQQSLGKEHLLRYATILRLDENEFRTCLESKKYHNEIQEDIVDAQAVEVKGTPTFFINGFKLEGAHPLSSFEVVFEELEAMEE